jgi:hypothetical protein
MAKANSIDIQDAGLNVVKNNVTRMVACSAQPTTFVEANATFALANITMASTDFTGPAAGTGTGRKITVAAKANVAVTATGTANHVALLDVTGSRLLYVTTAPAQSLTSGAQVSFTAWEIEIAGAA